MKFFSIRSGGQHPQHTSSQNSAPDRAAFWSSQSPVTGPEAWHQGPVQPRPFHRRRAAWRIGGGALVVAASISAGIGATTNGPWSATARHR